MAKQAPISLHHRHMEELQQMANIFAQASEEDDHAAPNVHKDTELSSSVTPIDPKQVKTAPIIHQNIT